VSKIQAPTNCPSCNSTLEWCNHLLYCRNASCASQASKRVEHFAKTLKIKGLGPATIMRLGLEDISDIYSLNEDQIVERLDSEALGSKLFVEIQNSKAAPLDVLLPAFSISLIGKTVSQKLSQTVKHLEEVNASTCQKAGLGPKASESLLGWLETTFPQYKALPFSFEFETKTTTTTPKDCVCISGKLKSFKTKAEAEKRLVEKGYIVKSSLTKDVTILVNESGIESAKTQKARESGITIVENLFDFIGE
jgi:NAD-dependent DNA ligase